jgi:hypothetical protein
MKYIWEATTSERLDGADISDVSFVPAQNFSPYMEVNSEYLNETRPRKDLRVEINPYVRFYDIFANYLDPAFSEFPEYRGALFDIVFHFLLATDRRSGHDRRSVRGLLIEDDISDGVFGDEIASLFGLLAERERAAIADGLISLYEHGLSVYLYEIVCRKMFPDMTSYLKTRGRKALLLYFGSSKTPQSEAAALLCQIFFLPADLPAEYYWEKHFGILGVSETMRLDDTVLI